MSAIQRLYEGTALKSEVRQAATVLDSLRHCSPRVNGRCMCCGEPESNHDRRAHLSGCPWAVAEEMGR